jgi:hypothetical protein
MQLQVNGAPTFDNLDSPEGGIAIVSLLYTCLKCCLYLQISKPRFSGLEALMQAVVCKNEIGWR